MRLGLKRVEGKELGMDRGKVLIKTGVLGRPQRGIWGERGASLRVAPALHQNFLPIFCRRGNK